MNYSNRMYKTASVLLSILLLVSAATAQKKATNIKPSGKPVLWEQVNIGQQDLIWVREAGRCGLT